MPRSRSLTQTLDFAIGAAAFLAVFVYYFRDSMDDLPFRRFGVGLVISVVTFWLGAERQNADDADWFGFIEQVSLSTGLNLIVQALLTYVFLSAHVPIFVIIVGSLVSGILLAISRAVIHPRGPRTRGGILFIGYEPACFGVINLMNDPVLGVLEARSEGLPAGLPLLGGIDRLEEVVAKLRPSRIVINLQAWASQISARQLLNLRLSGIVISDMATLYENSLNRVCSVRLLPSDFLLSPALTANRRTMAIQAIYTNLIGLFLLITLSPLLLLATLAVLSSGPGPIWESIPCVGFQSIPFHLFRFRTRRLGPSGHLTPVGKFLNRCHLTNLPQLVNVVRGEMALIGPSVARVPFADYLTQLLPFYSHRFSVKPGLWGWAQLHLDKHTVPNELSSLEYDLFYIKEHSPNLDLEILVRTILGAGRTSRKAVAAA